MFVSGHAVLSNYRFWLYPGFFFFYSYWGKECFLEAELEWRVLQQSFRLEETTERGTVFQFLVCLFFFFPWQINE